MKYLFVFCADWANGLFAVLLASAATGVEIVWWYFLIGLALAHSPDLDALPELLRRGKVAASVEHQSDHRDGLHYPILWLVVGAGAAYVLGFWGYVFLFATTLHFFNDFYGTGWGIKLLWPLSQRSYKLLGRRVNRLKTILQRDGDWEKLSRDERTLRLIVSWSPAELPAYMSRWGIENWIKEYYGRLNWIATIEIVLFLLAISLTILTLIY